MKEHVDKLVELIKASSKRIEALEKVDARNILSKLIARENNKDKS